MMFNLSKNIIKNFLRLSLVLMLGIPFLTLAQINSQINYQGKLTDASGVAVPDGLYNMNFWLIASDVAATSTAVWSESLTGGNRVQVTNGLFSVMLGEQSSLDGVDFNQTLYLGVEIGGTGAVTPAWDGEMSPRKILGTVPAAFEAKNAQTLDGIATSSFLRSDQTDTASGLLTFSGGLISTASSTITNLTTNIATTTTLVINNQSFTNLLGLGLTNQAGVLTVSTTTLGFGTLAALNSVDISSNTNLSVSATGLSLSGDAVALTAGYNIPLTASTTNWNNTYNTVTAGSASWNAAAASTTALTPTYIRGLFSSSATGLTYTSATGAFSLTAGYNIPLTASTTNWNNFYNTPSTRIAVTNNLAWSTNTLGVTSGYNIPLTASTTNWNNTYNTVTAGSASWNAAAASTTALTPTYIRGLFTGGTGITQTSGDISFDCSEVEGTGINCSGEAITLDATGDWTGTFDGQEGTYYLSRANHTGTQTASTISDFSTTARGLFSSSATGLTYTSATGAFSLTAGYNIPLTASTTNWNNFYNTPSTRISTANNLTWSSNTLGVTSGYNIPLTASTTEWHNKVSSQWTSAGSDIYYSSGNVGIGTSTPAELFTVTGTSSVRNILPETNLAYSLGSLSKIFKDGWISNLNISAGTSVPGLVLGEDNLGGESGLVLTDTSTALAVYWPGSGYYYGGSGSSSDGKLMVGESGNVGIGTASPGAKLEVVGDIISKGTEWTSRTSAANNSWYSVTYGNGLFVAVSYDGTNRVMTSPDGINWTSRSAAVANNWSSVTYGNGLFVAVASSGTGNRVMTSPDGITWTSRTSAADNAWQSVTYGNGLFVAVSYTGTGNRVMTSPDGITWTSRTSAVDNFWQSVTYGNGLFVAVSYTGTGNRVMTSPDGITWTSQTSAANNDWYSVTYGNGLFVAVAGSGSSNRVMTSPDGITWTSQTSAVNNQWLSVTYGNGLFVAVSYDGTSNRVMTSPDGINWTSRTSAADNQWRSITYGNGIFVAVSQSGTGNRVMTSGKTDISALAHNNLYQGGMSIMGSVGIGTSTPNGLLHTYTNSSSNITFESSYADYSAMLITHNSSGVNLHATGGAGGTPGAFLFNTGASFEDPFGTTPKMILTEDGRLGLGTTTPSSFLHVQNPNGLADITLESADGDDTALNIKSNVVSELTFSSLAGSNMARISYDASINSSLRFTTYGGGDITLHGSSGKFGIGSTTPSELFTVTGTSSVRNILPETNLTYGLGSSAKRFNEGWISTLNVGTSTWSMTQSSNGRFSLFDAASGGGTERFSILSSSGNVGIGSTNPGAKLEVVGDIISKGTEWTSRTSAADNPWYAITYGNGLFVAVAGSGTYQVMTSPDGINWTTRSAAAANSWYSVTYGNGLFVAVAGSGTGNRVMTSPDGITWTSRTSAADNSWQSVTYGNGLFVAVSNTGTGNRVMTSPDGITWTSRTSAANNNWRSVIYGNSLFVAVSDSGTGNRVMTSPDGITWTIQTSAADNIWRSITYGNGLFVAVSVSGTGNRVMTSPDGITWTSRTSAADNSWDSVTYGNGLFVAASYSGTGNRVMTSPDGITWTSRTSAADISWNDIVYGNGLFVAVSYDGTGNRVMTSGKTEISALAHNNLYQGGLNIMGNVGIGTTSPQRAFHVQITTDAPPVRFQDSNGYCEINPTSATWTCTSDRRLKENIETLSRPEILTGINALRSVSFSWISDKNSKTQTGFIAQEVEEIFPELVATDPQTGYKSVGYGGFTPYLVASIQEIDSILGSPTASSTTGQSFSESIIFGKIIAAFEYIGIQIRDSILTVAGINVNRVEINNELCVEGVCVDANKLRTLLETVDTPDYPVDEGEGSGGEEVIADTEGGNEGVVDSESINEEATEPETLEEPEVEPILEPPIEEVVTEEVVEEPELPVEEVENTE